jgi:hypothetical protein
LSVTILTAKHGQTPIDPTKARIVDEKLIPSILNGGGKDMVAESSGDDVLLIWLKDSSKTTEAVAALADHQNEAHISRIISGADLKLFFPDPRSDSRAPDLIIEPELGVIYTKPSSTGIAEHGGFQDLDTHVPLLISNPAYSEHEIHAVVQTTQIAPTILRLLEIDPRELKAVRIEKTQTLPEF